MARSNRARKLFLCAAIAAPMLMGGVAAASEGGYGHHRPGHSHVTNYAGCLVFNGHRYHIGCSDRALYDIGRVFHRHGYRSSYQRGELVIRVGWGHRRPRVSWVADRHRGSVSYRGDCIVIKLYSPAGHRYDYGRGWTRYDDRDRYDRHYDRYEPRQYRRYSPPPRRYYRPYRRPSRCW